MGKEGAKEEARVVGAFCRQLFRKLTKPARSLLVVVALVWDLAVRFEVLLVISVIRKVEKAGIRGDEFLRKKIGIARAAEIQIGPSVNTATCAERRNHHPCFLAKKMYERAQGVALTNAKIVPRSDCRGSRGWIR